MTLTVFLILTLAAFRLSRLIIEDTITEPIRTWILGRWPGSDVKYDESDYVKGGTVRVGVDLYAAEPTKVGDKIAKLLGCYWCTMPYVSVVCYLSWRFFPTVAEPVLTITAIAGAGAIIGTLMHEATE